MSAGSKAIILIALFVLEDSQQFLGNVLGKILVNASAVFLLFTKQLIL